jgi:molybdenum cofactor cytidylyltransferase
MVSAILLGAGQSKRMGVDKLSLPWRKKTILEVCLRVLLRSEAGEVVVVVNEAIRDLLAHWEDERLKVVVNSQFRKGMSTSIVRGLHALSAQSKGILIALGDQPGLRTSTINALIHAFVPKGRAILVPTYRGRRGNPVIFDRSYEKELLALRGDVGARSLLERYSDRISKVRTKSEAVLKDIDLWEDYVSRAESKRAHR